MLYKTQDETIVRKQDETTIVSDIGNNLVGRKLVFDYIDSEWDYFLNKYGSVSFTLPNLISRTFSKLNTEFELKKLNQFKIDHSPLEIAGPAFNELLETVSANTNWMNKNLNAITQWLTDKKKQDSENKKEYRLPSNLIPTNYKIFIKPYFKIDTLPEVFDGKVEIEFGCVKSTNAFVIHIDSLTLNDSTLLIKGVTNPSYEQKTFSYTYDQETNLLSAVLNNELKANDKYVFSVEYKGKYFTDNLGFYRNEYKNASNITNYLVSSQFEPVKARRAFPCFDEPAMKSTFSITVHHDSSLKAISNMPDMSTKPM